MRRLLLLAVAFLACADPTPHESPSTASDPSSVAPNEAPRTAPAPTTDSPSAVAPNELRTAPAPTTDSPSAVAPNESPRTAPATTDAPSTLRESRTPPATAATDPSMLARESRAPNLRAALGPATTGLANAPEGVVRLTAHLRARHARDLPRPAHLASYNDAASALRWIATHDRRMIVRARALATLQYDASDATRSLLLGVLRDRSAHASLRAAAIMGTEGLSMTEPLRTELAAAQRDRDPRVRHAAEQALHATRR